MSSDVTVVIPSIPPRARGPLLERALKSVWRQRTPADAVVVTLDTDRAGAAINRDRGLALVKTEWVAFLDDDDELYPGHLGALLEAAAATGADLVYPWFDVRGGTDPFPHHEGKPFDPAQPCQVPITFLARTALVRDVGGFSAGWTPELAEDPGTDPDGNRAGEDYRLLLRLVEANALIWHHPERTWRWHHHGANTSGLASRWR